MNTGIDTDGTQSTLQLRRKAFIGAKLVSGIKAVTKSHYQLVKLRLFHRLFSLFGLVRYGRLPACGKPLDKRYAGPISG
jgi:hypothetical protein